MNYSSRKTSAAPPDEKKSVKFLMEKMGMSRKEVEEVSCRYGVTATKLIELMQLSKYHFIYTGQESGQCKPCAIRIDRMRAINF